MKGETVIGVCSWLWFCMALIIGVVLCARSADSFVSANAWGAFRFSYAIDIFISCPWLQNDGVDLAGIGASA